MGGKGRSQMGRTQIHTRIECTQMRRPQKQRARIQRSRTQCIRTQPMQMQRVGTTCSQVQRLPVQRTPMQRTHTESVRKRFLALTAVLLLVVATGTALAPAASLAAVTRKWVPPAASTDYAYDDLAVQVSLHYVGWGYSKVFPDQKPSGNDPIIAWLERQLNTRLTMEFLPKALEELPLKVAAGIPDFWLTYDRSLALRFVEQGLATADLGLYLKYLPTYASLLSESDLKTVTAEGGRIFAIPLRPPLKPYIWWIRKDWLDKLGLSMPRSLDELYDAAFSFTFKDPDGNRKADTWGFGTAGNGQGLGTLIQGIAGPLGAAPGGVELSGGVLRLHDLSDEYRQALSFMRKIVQAKVIDPGWYAQTWEQLKNERWQGGRVGIVAGGWWEANTADVRLRIVQPSGDMQPIPRLSGPKGSRFGMAEPVARGFVQISTRAATNPAKLKRILHLLDLVMAPSNPGWWATNPGVLPNGETITGSELVRTIDSHWQTDTVVDLRTTPDGWFLWAHKQLSDNERDWALGDGIGRDMDWGYGVQKANKAIQVAESYDYFENMVNHLVTPDPAIWDRLEAFMRKNEYAFVTGKRSLDEWDAYVREAYKRFGAGSLLKDYARQLEKLGQSVVRVVSGADTVFGF